MGVGFEPHRKRLGTLMKILTSSQLKSADGRDTMRPGRTSTGSSSARIIGASATIPAARMEELLSRHRKEAKDLQNRITGMKKQATKSTRKEVNSKCASLQENMRAKHEQEVRELESGRNGSEPEREEDVTPEQLLQELDIRGEEGQLEAGQASRDAEPHTKKRRNRQKERLARREAEIERIKEEAKKEAAEQPDLSKIEQEAIDELCALKSLRAVDIQPDGHCLFASIADQVRIRHGRDDFDVYRLRSLACDYMRENREEFVPYLFDEQTMQLRDIEEYTQEMESTAKWGGELEIMALAKCLDCPISVLMSGRPVHIVNEDSKNAELKLVYYRHTYALGEHYNSLHDV